MKKKPAKGDTEFERFETLTRNLVAVSNVEVRKKLEEEKQAKAARRAKKGGHKPK
jgi:hypothetical protein